MPDLLDQPSPTRPAAKRCARPRLGFLGVGWIGRNRMEAMAASGAIEITAIAETSEALRTEAARIEPRAAVLDSLDALLEVELDGVVIATPSALHADQAVAALERGLAVFCQKPLGRNAAETRRVIDAARSADRLLGVDLSYRFITGVQRIRELNLAGELGDIYAVDLTFHNAYGPDKPWFYDARLSGGGCVIDLGIHLVDLALWTLQFPRLRNVTSRLFAQGRPLARDTGEVEDYAMARLDLETGAAVQLACSWKLPAGCDAVISAAFYGTRGGAAIRNVGGSFYDFVAERFIGTRREILSDIVEPWGPRAAVNWAEQLARGGRYSPDVEDLLAVAESLDCIYGNSRLPI
ncbi:MAG TPA: Gfo/Idh/MocA family oxidoreductase [Verrucomicrobiae bacterium]|nr:Gfo/Idh/MocA family oxidoreductase [Verrucomicrobiae bacterium]